MFIGQKGLVVSGHRNVTKNDMGVIHSSMREFIGYEEFDYIVFGGARGTDTLALASALDLRQTGMKVPTLVVVVPDRLVNQPVETRDISLKADRLIELKHPITSEDHFWALQHRNEVMVDLVFPEGHLLALWNTKPSGTANAVRYARELGVDVSVRTLESF